MRFYRYWKDLSVSTKLYTVVGTMAVLIMVELFTLMFAMDILSAVRAFVGGEGLWSKAQKNAVLEIQIYLNSRDEKDYHHFLKDMSVPMGDHQARVELMKPVVSEPAVTEGFLKGKNNIDDIPPMIRLMRRFYRVSYLAKAITVWGKADTVADEMLAVGREVHAEVQNTPRRRSLPHQAQLLKKISKINDEATILEDEFSSTLGEASRWIEHRLLLALLIAVLMVESTGLLLTFRFSRVLTRELREINAAANQVGSGDFTKVIAVNSQDELGQLAGAINKMSASLNLMKDERLHAEEASQVKSLFLANMSHEIRTPMGAILGFIELLKSPDLTESEKMEYLEIIGRTGDTVVSIINDILDISKVEAGKIEIRPENFSLSKLMGDLKNLMSLRCEDKGIRLRMKPAKNIPEFITTDPARLRQILLNIIGNAIKFTDKGEINVSYELQGSRLEFVVRDTGKGIAPENRSRLFKIFSQVDNSIRKTHGGTGLGLALSRNLAQLMGGDVTLHDSGLGIGSEFKIAIAVEVPTVSSRPVRSTLDAALPQGLPLAGLKILVVDDAADNQYLFGLILRKNGALVSQAVNGLEGVRKALAEDFDLILMDMQMPVLDGYSATAQLRAKNYQKPIFALTALTSREDLNACIKAGCTQVLQKPLKPSLLIQHLSPFNSRQKAS